MRVGYRDSVGPRAARRKGEVSLYVKTPFQEITTRAHEVKIRMEAGTAVQMMYRHTARSDALAAAATPAEAIVTVSKAILDLAATILVAAGVMDKRTIGKAGFIETGDDNITLGGRSRMDTGTKLLQALRGPHGKNLLASHAEADRTGLKANKNDRLSPAF